MTKNADHRLRSKTFRSSNIRQEIEALLSKIQSKGLCLDLPVGNGQHIERIRKAGFEPVGADLYPEDAVDKTPLCIKANFTKPLPFKVPIIIFFPKS